MGGSCGGGDWLSKAAFGTWQVVTWSDVICWHLMAEGLKGATESKLEYFIWGLEPSGRGIQWTSFSAPVRIPFQWWYEAKAELTFGFISARAWSGSVTWWVNTLNFGLQLFWLWKDFLKGVFCHRKAKKKIPFQGNIVMWIWQCWEAWPFSGALYSQSMLDCFLQC